MKKHVKRIALLSAAVLLLTGIAYRFRGLPYYLKAKMDFSAETLEWNPEQWSFTDKGTLENSKKLIANGVSVKVPKSLEPDPQREHLYRSENGQDGSVALVLGLEPVDWGDFALDDLDGVTEEKLTAYLKSIGHDLPHNQCEMQELLYDLKPEDCDLHDHTNAGIFYMLENVKDKIAVFGQAQYRIHTATAIGLASVLYPNAGNAGYLIQLQLFSKADPNTSYFASISAPDFDTACRIANSVELVQSLL